MDAHGLLTSQGWRGTGHSLHPINDKTGLSRPLLASRKDNVLGVGKKQHKTSDMWWMNAFDSSLKGLDTSKQGTVVQTVTGGGLEMVVKGGGKFVGKKGLYSSFVRGECLRGTIGEEIITSQSSGTSTPDVQGGDKEEDKKRRKRNRDGLETKEERRARKAARRAARAKLSTREPTKDEEVEEESVKKAETKEERRDRKRLKKLAKEAPLASIEVTSQKAKKKKRRKD